MTKKVQRPSAGDEVEKTVYHPGAKSETSDPTHGEFNENMYLRLNPDVMIAVAGKLFGSGRDHYDRVGRAEGRLTTAPPTKQLDRITITGPFRDQPRAPATFVEEVKISPAGGLYLVGWVNDAFDPLDRIDLYCPSWSIQLDATKMARVRRTDGEAAIGLQVPYCLGFWYFLYVARPLSATACTVVVRFESGAGMQFVVQLDLVSDEELRSIALCYLAQANYPCSQYFAPVKELDAQCGGQLVNFNRMLTQIAVNAPYVEHFGRTNATYKGSIIVCLFERLEYMFLQQAMFSRQPDIDDFEFIYICNSVHLAESLLREARAASLVYGLDLTIILPNSNAGFGAANNLAAQHARSSRLVFLNPDVFPRDKNWAAKHTAIVDLLPSSQTALFGAPLYYDDGSLMHGGMYFEIDSQPMIRNGAIQNVDVIRVEHYGKGAPPETPDFLRVRPVPAITGAFMSLARTWFERLEGFSRDYIFGHYEDADLCLRSLTAGQPAWLHDAQLWHLEGKGSTKQKQHEGGAIVNRWLFTSLWKDNVRNGILGPHPLRADLRK